MRIAGHERGSEGEREGVKNWRCSTSGFKCDVAIITNLDTFRAYHIPCEIQLVAIVASLAVSVFMVVVLMVVAVIVTLVVVIKVLV